MAIVAGVAIDKGEKEPYKITVEIVNLREGEQGTIMTSKTISMEGKTLFDAVRNEISLSGKKLYWSHAKVIIISKEIAREGVTKITDWFYRDSETRANIHILVSKHRTAKEIYDEQAVTEKIKSFEMDDMLRNESNLSKAPTTEMWDLTSDIQSKGVDATVPLIGLKDSNGIKVPQIWGTALFREDKMIGTLSSSDTKILLMIKDQLEGGVITQPFTLDDESFMVSLEIFKNKTNLEPVIEDGELTAMKVNVELTTAVDEVSGHANLMDQLVLKKLEQTTAKTLEKRIKKVVKHVQATYNTDCFGFGEKLRKECPKIWKKYEADWRSQYRHLAVEPVASVHIKNTAMLKKTMNRK